MPLKTSEIKNSVSLVSFVAFVSFWSAGGAQPEMEGAADCCLA